MANRGAGARFPRSGRFVADHIFELHDDRSFLSPSLGFPGVLRVVHGSPSFSHQDCFQHFPIRFPQRSRGRGVSTGFTTQGHDLVGKEFGVQRLVGHFGQEELGQLRAEGASGFGRIGEVLDDRAESRQPGPRSSVRSSSVCSSLWLHF